MKKLLRALLAALCCACGLGGLPSPVQASGGAYEAPLPKKKR